MCNEKKIELALASAVRRRYYVTLYSEDKTMTSTVNVGAIAGTALRGKIDGRAHFGVLCTALAEFPSGSVIELDFQRVKELSASWIAAALLPLIDWANRSEQDYYPVLRNIADNEKRWVDDFELVAEKAGAVFLWQNSRDGDSAHLIGKLDAALKQTLQAVQEHGEVTGAGLKREFPTEPIGATGWSNRLKDLHGKRLVRRQIRGREYLYQVVLEVDLDGTPSARVADRNIRTPETTRRTGRPIEDPIRPK